METPQVIAALAALAQDTRLAIFRLLVQTGPQGLAASKIADALNVAPSSLSFHLKDLAQAGLISATPRGRFIIYAADFAAMGALIGFLTDNCCGGNACLPVASNVCADSCASR